MPSKKDSNGRPQISTVTPEAAIPGGEFQIRGAGLAKSERPRVTIGDMEAPIVIGSDSCVIVRVPEGASAGDLVVANGALSSQAWTCDIGIQIAENLYPVGNPAVDSFGNIYVTFSGSRGQKTPVSVYKIDLNYNPKSFVTDIMNATGLAFEKEGVLYVSSRYDGIIYQVTQNASVSPYVEGMGVATGIAFDADENLYVGDRGGTVFKISRTRQIFVFATLEPSVSAYHMAFGPGGDLFVTGPTTSSFDSVHKIDSHGSVSTFYRGLGRPQGLAFDIDGNLYVAASLSGKRGIVKITPDGKASLEVAGPGLVGLAFAPGRSAVLATTNGVHHLSWGIQGLPPLSELPS